MAMPESAAVRGPARPPQFNVVMSEPDPKTGFRAFELGQFHFLRDDYFVVWRDPSTRPFRARG